MRLKEFGIANFQSYQEEQRIPLDTHTTLLAGRNNVGKSALLRALQIPLTPQEGARPGLRLSYHWSIEAEVLRAAFPPGADPQGQNNAKILDWLLTSRSAVSLDLRAEFVIGGAITPTQPQALNPVVFEVPELGAKAVGQPGTQLGWQQGPFASSGTGVSQLNAIAGVAMKNILYLGPRRIEQGRRQLRAVTQLQPDARDLTDVLLHIQLNEVDTFDELMRIMRGAFPDIRRMSVRHESELAGGTLMGEPVIYFEKRETPIPLRLCGTGIEQMLALSVGILTAHGPRLFLIDEPQAYLHPHAERSLLALLDGHTEHQYLVATHSNVLLRSRPLTQVRLVYLEDGYSHIAGDTQTEQLLSELGVTAADLWLADRLLWVEGPSEEEVLALLADNLLSPAQRAALVVRRMPEAASRFATKSSRSMDAAYRFCAEAARAISPLPVKMRFLFDSDEKSAEFRKKIGEASGDRAIFLPTRELENVFLEPMLLYQALGAIARKLELTLPSLEAVRDELALLLAATDDEELYPNGVLGGDQSQAVRGSRVLQRLWWKFAMSPYDKVRDGRAIAEIALREGSEALAPLKRVLEALVVPGRAAPNDPAPDI